MFQGFGHTAIWVRDMEKSLHFYCDILGGKKAFFDGSGRQTLDSICGACRWRFH